jgi:hypothetical protein
MSNTVPNCIGDVPINDGVEFGKSVRVEEFKLGKAIVLPDTADVWQKRIGSDRPQYLEMYREEAWDSSEDAPPAIGTAIVSGDDDWLEEYAERIVSILYFLCDSNTTLRPAELFRYHRLSTKTGDGTFTVLHNKFASSGEGVFDESGGTVRSLSIYPPSVIRGVQRKCHVDFSLPHSTKLIDRFKRNPADRLFVAIRQYFRAQFADLFSSTFESDYACYCASLEAALKLPEGEQTGKEFEKQLVDFYDAKELCPSKEELRKLFSGWFGARSLYVHGGSGGKSKRRDRQEAYEYWQSLQFKTSVARNVCREAILRSIDDKNDHDTADQVIDLVLASKKVWSQLKKEVIRDAAAKRITSRDDYKVFYEIAENVSNRFDWACVSPLPSPRTMHRGLLTLVLVLGHLTDSSGRVYELVVELGKAADARSDDAVRDWLRNASSWKSVKRENDIEVIQYLTWKLAESFRKLRPK